MHIVHICRERDGLGHCGLWQRVAVYGDRQIRLRACSTADIAGEIECIQPSAKAHGPRTRAVEFAAAGMEFHGIECSRCT